MQVLLLGIIEGITEFLPISSTGHLLIAEHWLGRRSDLFNVAIQAGAILAVVVIYWRRLLDLALHFSSAENRGYVGKLTAAVAITVAGGFVAKQMGLELPDTVAPIAWALILGGLAIFAIEAYASRQPPSDVLTEFSFLVGIPTMFAATAYGLPPIPVGSCRRRELDRARCRVRRVGSRRIHRCQVVTAIRADA